MANDQELKSPEDRRLRLSAPSEPGFAGRAKPQAAASDWLSRCSLGLNVRSLAMPRLLLVWLTLGLGGLSARARDPEVVIPQLAKVQDKIIIEGNSEFPYIWVAYEGYKPLKEPDGEEFSGADPLPYLKPCVYAGIHQGTRGTYLLLAESDEKGKVMRRLGWVDERYGVRPEALKDEVTKIYRKGMIVNTVSSIKAEQPVEKAPVLLAPEEKAKAARDPFALFNIYFIYADTDPRQPEKGY